jgi:hypothetical protein
MWIFISGYDLGCFGWALTSPNGRESPGKSVTLIASSDCSKKKLKFEGLKFRKESLAIL